MTTTRWLCQCPVPFHFVQVPVLKHFTPSPHKKKKKNGVGGGGGGKGTPEGSSLVTLLAVRAPRDK